MKINYEKENYIKLISVFKKYYKRYYWLSIIESAGYFLLSLITFLTVFSLAESFLYLRTSLKTIFFFGTTLISAIIAISLLIKKIVFKPDAFTVSKDIEKKFPGLRERLISAVQLGNLKAGELRGQSQEIIDAHTEKVLKEIASMDVASSIPLKNLKLSLRLPAYSLIVFFIFSGFMPSRFISGFYRFLDYSKSYSRPDNASIYLINNKSSIIKGDDFALAGFVSGEKPREIKAFYRWDGISGWNSKPVILNDKNGSFSLAIEKPQKSFSFYLESELSSTDKYSVTVIERPEINGISVSLAYPGYSGQTSEKKTNSDGNIRAITGTEAELTINATKTLKSMSLVWSDSTITPCAINGDTGSIKFTVKKNADYTISVIDTLGLANANPISYRVSCIEDEFPSITLINPNSDVTLNRSMTVPLVYNASDDYGITSVRLGFKRPFVKNQEEIVLLKGNQGKTINGEYLWNLSSLNLLPEDEMTFYVYVSDNDSKNGFKKSYSDTIKVRLPSMTEVLNESVKEQNAGIEKLKDITRNTESQNKKIDDVDKNLMKGRELDWADKKALEDAKTEMSQMQKDAKEISENMRDTAEKLSEDDLAALETIEKMKKISEIIDSIADGEMKEALKQLTMANIQPDPQQVRDAIEKYKITSEDIKKKLDNVIKYLEQIKTIQRFEISKKLLEDMAAKQKELSEKYKKSIDKESLAREQEKLSSEMEKIEKETAEALEELKENFHKNSPSLMKSMENGDVSQNQKKTSDMMTKGNSSEAQSGLQKSNSMLSEMLNQMEMMNSSMMSSNSQELKKRLFTALTEMLAVSDRQEKFIYDSENSEPGKISKDGFLKGQLDIIDGFSKAEKSLSSLGEIMIELTGIVGQMNASTRMAMESSADLYATGNLSAGNKNARESLKILNSNILILTKMLQQANGNMQGGLPGDMMQQLQDMANGQLSLQQRLGSEQLQKLAAEQQKLSELLESLTGKISDDPQLKQMLEKLADEMEETSKMMSRNEKRELVERRQLDIYRRLLDAKRSRREKDEKDNIRKSWTSKRNVSRGADELAADYGEKEKEINKRIKNLMNEDFDPEYKKMIRLYMESLLKKQDK